MLSKKFRVLEKLNLSLVFLTRRGFWMKLDLFLMIGKSLVTGDLEPINNSGKNKDHFSNIRITKQKALTSCS